MTEKLDFKTDEELNIETQHIGTDPLTGPEMYRRYRILASDSYSQEDLIHYEEWLVAKDGKIYNELYSQKKYIVKDIPEVLYTKDEMMLNGQIALGTEVKISAIPQYTNWFAQLKPILLPSINKTLLAIPIDSPVTYYVKP